MATVPPLVDDVVEDILLCFPPDNPAALVRAVLVCKDWRRLVSNPRFRRRFHEVHGAVPMLGFLQQRGALFRFQPTTSFRPRFPLSGGERGRGAAFCWADDARHGRVLINSSLQGIFLVWDPITGDLRTLPRPRILASCHTWTAAFVCAAIGCDHLDCTAAGAAFRVVFVGTRWRSPPPTSIYVYSSATGRWSDELTTVQHMNPIGSGRAAMVGNALYFWFQRRSGILKHDLDTQMSCVEQTPASVDGNKRVLLTATEDGRLGFAMIQKSKLSMWSRGAGLGGNGKDTDAGWAQDRVIELSTLLPASALSYPPQLVAFADGIGVTVMVQTVDGLFAVDVKSSRVREIGKFLKLHSYGVVPFVS